MLQDSSAKGKAICKNVLLFFLSAAYPFTEVMGK